MSMNASELVPNADYLDIINVLRPSTQAPYALAIVSCGKSKDSYRTEAENLYTSPFFKINLSVAKKISVAQRIFSAKHGLIELDTKIDPYEQQISSLTGFEKNQLKETVRAQMRAISEKSSLVIFAGRDYSDILRSAIEGQDQMILDPLEGLSLGYRMKLLKIAERFSKRTKIAERVYAYFDRQFQLGRVLPGSAILSAELPKRGLYVFFDPTERTVFSNRTGRVVRIGTHALHERSKSILRTRLRAHIGNQNLHGNHRGSIFRLHVGQSIISKEFAGQGTETWGRGQNAEKAIREQEVWLELLVSKYISNLLILPIEVGDLPVGHQTRSQLESAMIALFTDSSLPLEPPSKSWLGQYSLRPQIAKSGLWNVQYSGLELVGEHSSIIDKYLIESHK